MQTKASDRACADKSGVTDLLSYTCDEAQRIPNPSCHPLHNTQAPNYQDHEYIMQLPIEVFNIHHHLIDIQLQNLGCKYKVLDCSQVPSKMIDAH